VDASLAPSLTPPRDSAPPTHSPTHAFFSPQACRPLHLLADVSFSSGNHVGLTAYGAHPASAQRRTVFAFQRLKLGMVAGPEERVAIDTFAKAVTGACVCCARAARVGRAWAA
jgi:hypothetical protein